MLHVVNMNHVQQRQLRLVRVQHVHEYLHAHLVRNDAHLAPGLVNHSAIRPDAGGLALGQQRWRRGSVQQLV